MISKSSRSNPTALLSLSALLVSFLTAPAALAILPPNGPTVVQEDSSSAQSQQTGPKRGHLRSELFLLHSNAKERVEAQVQISTLTDKISHLEEASIIVPEVDTKRFSPELIERAINMIRMHYLAALLTERGTLLAVVGDTDRAIADLGEALDSDSKNFQAYNNRACLKAAVGDYTGALSDANKALSLQPNFAEALDTRGTVYLAQGQYQKAAVDLDKAISSKPKYAEAFFHRSLVMKALGKEDASVSDFKKAKELGF